MVRNPILRYQVIKIYKGKPPMLTVIVLDVIRPTCTVGVTIFLIAK